MNPEAVHKLAGALILGFSGLALAKEAGQLHGKWQGYVLPVGILGVGLFLVLDPIAFHRGDFGAEGRQHQLQGMLLLLVAGIELARCRGKLQHRAFGAALPLVIVTTGLLFFVHDQHGSGDATLQSVQHRILGATIMFAGLVRGADSMGLAKGNWASVGWLLLLVVVTLELFLYVEAGGAGEPRPKPVPTSPHEEH
jgi:hypothetical protein